MTGESNGLPGLPARRPLLWPWILATLIVVGLLLAILQVVQAAVLHGELRRKASATHAEGTWRCNASRSASQREDCMTKLGSLPERDAPSQDQSVLTAGANTSPWLPSTAFTQVHDHE